MTTIIGLFDSVSEAEKAARDLMSTGFSHEDIGLIASDATGEWSRYKVSTLEGAAPSPRAEVALWCRTSRGRSGE